ncbi:hypothetical protein GOODEAATRI_015027 [Goodea atripinnis]|uniref:Sushi domain-containing protein n=1 Tax=Goodea atripinnis TaxID=208336 RepID=A0ABV0N1J8_9TELE
MSPACVRRLRSGPFMTDVALDRRSLWRTQFVAVGAVLTADSIGGSTPDRAHDWGSPPFKKPPRIPGLSHWIYDVLSFYYCCLWSDNCHYYFKHRPSSDCRRYQSPSSDSGTTIKATKLTAVAMRERLSDIIEVRLDGRNDGLEVLRNQQTLSFAEQTWMDLQGVFVFSPTSTNVTIMFPSGAGVEVRRRGETMTTTVLLPEEFKDSTLGLLGKMNGDAKDDLALTNGQLVQNHSNPEELFNFGASLISCGWLPPPTNGKKQGTTYLQGAKVQFSCDEGYTLSGSTVRTCQSNGKWSGEDTSCLISSMKSR